MMKKKYLLEQEGRKRSIVTIVLSLALVAALTVGMSLAFLTDNFTALLGGQMTPGVIELERSTVNLAGGVLMPGSELEISPDVALAEGSQEAFVRVRMVGEAVPGLQALLEANLDNGAWELSRDGNEIVILKNTALAAGNTVTPITGGVVEVPTTHGNDELSALGGSLNIYVEAIQAEGFGSSSAAFGSF